MSSKMYQEAMKQEKEAKDSEVKKDKKGKKDKVIDAEVINDEEEDK